MWPSPSLTLAPLTKSTYTKRHFKWTQVKQDAFKKMKTIVACNTLSNYPDLNETFKIHTNVSEFQLGAVISQKVKPIAFYSRKLTDAQQWYTLT